jgi:hypothetical protein
LLAGAAVQRHEPGVQSRQVDVVAVDRQSSVHQAAADCRRSRLVLVAPELAAGAAVEREDDVPRLAVDQHPVYRDRRALVAIGASGEAMPVVMPESGESSDVMAVDLREWREALVGVVVAVREPLARRGVRREQPRVGDRMER